MPWDKATRDHYTRSTYHYESNVSDAEWALVEPFLPVASARGRPLTTDLRTVFNAIQYILATGCKWPCVAAMFSAIYYGTTSFLQMA